MTRDTSENPVFKGRKTGATGVIFQSPLIMKAGKSTKMTITGR